MDMSMTMPTATATATATGATPSSTMDMSGMSGMSGHDPAMPMTMDMSQMAMVFFQSVTSPLFAKAWTPAGPGAYAGTCIFLIVLATLHRVLIAVRNLVFETGPHGHRKLDPDEEEAAYMRRYGRSAGVLARIRRALHDNPFRIATETARAFSEVVVGGIGYLLPDGLHDGYSSFGCAVHEGISMGHKAEEKLFDHNVMDVDTEDSIRTAGMGRITLKGRERNFRGQEFDRYFFNRKFEEMQVVKEATTYLEILNYTDGRSLVESQALALGDDFYNFLTQEGVFAAPQVTTDVELIDGIRLIIQQDAKDEKTFSPDHISLPKDSYKTMMETFRLPLQALETSTVVGPFFWWAQHEDSEGKHLQIVFRKSDVQWVGNPRGWQMILSYSFKTRITSGFVKGTANAELGEIMSQLQGCGSPVHHPLLLPIIMLCQDLGASNDEQQKDIRRGIRDLDRVLTGNYRNVTAAASHISPGDLTLEKISQKIAGYQSKVNWKRPQAWKSVLGKIRDTAEWWWDNAENPLPALDRLHRSLLDRLLFYNVKLDGLENYAHVSLARLDNLRQVTNVLISQVESRLNAEVSIQQHLLANASKRDSASMKTLTILGAVFLPGTFLSSMFSMPFFDFQDMNGPVSKSLWIYFALLRMVLHAGTRMGADEDYEGAEAHLNRLEGQILEKIRDRTGANLTWTVAPSRRLQSRLTRSTGGEADGTVASGAAAAANTPPRWTSSRILTDISRIVPGSRHVRSAQDVELRQSSAI
ncbi:uncharacterized protein PG986_002864 [Apiospora aurea]|uniref:Uncharacterized protein n=1 Tax=Apiospora aurea TaxID=335848 RepID=A0ABR1QQL3_9PEZI